MAASSCGRDSIASPMVRRSAPNAYRGRLSFDDLDGDGRPDIVLRHFDGRALLRTRHFLCRDKDVYRELLPRPAVTENEPDTHKGVPAKPAAVAPATSAKRPATR